MERRAPINLAPRPSSRPSPCSVRLGRLIAAILMFATAAACHHRDLRGTTSASPDGKTYLAVVDNNGGACGLIQVDGQPWPHPIGEPGRIEPGVHRISCGSDIEFEIPQGVVFRFDYWGP